MSQVAQKIVEDSQAKKRWPLLMKHPQYQKATISGYKRNADGSATDDPPGVAGKFQDHWVHNTDQEQYYASQGYVPVGVTDVDAYRRVTCGIDTGASDPNYPKALYRVKADGEMDSALASDIREHTTLAKDGWKESIQAAKDAGSAKIVKIAKTAEAAVKPKKVTKAKAAPAVEALPVPVPKKRVMSPETKAKIADAIRAKHAAKKAAAKK